MSLHDSLPPERTKTSADIAAGESRCAVCSREPQKGTIELKLLDEELGKLIRANAPGVDELESVCIRCARIFDRCRDSILKDAALKKDGSHVLSTPLRLGSVDRYTGKGTTIAFLDSGFYPHPDLTKPKNRIIGYRSLLHKEGDDSQLYEPDVASWHGMMTSVVASGNGWLSNGFYRGLAPDSKVVLVKLAKTGRITEQNIQDGLEWVLENRTKFGIDVVNISAGGDFEQSYLHDSLSQVVEECSSQGIVVVCAVGNAGDLPTHPVFPPASAPSCIAVGGLDDNNSIDRSRRGMYRSSYGPTVDGLQKPEVIAPSIWVPAPILPGTPTAKQAEFLESLDKSADKNLHDKIRKNPGVVSELDAAIDRPVHSLRQIIILKLRQESVINKYYKYVDGTSFSSPIVSSVVAQMIEADPKLTVQQIKRILISTAERLPHYEVDRQGWGVIDPRKAVEAAEEMSTERRVLRTEEIDD
ncbi:MAG: serine protease [Acidobacteria bacterium]|nr:MAG: serine protease [Acidobacteriota bacterium]REK02775.1 MAG: serine protease [Acidobacteriota bacterium]REK13420.1 MAG: serine protease [Acidobacteriota bacterium]REK41414.1 MAG: serine protease [Acidobacteriota bacterium]